MGIFSKVKPERNSERSSHTDKFKQFVHSPLKTEHKGVQIEIKENGKIVLSKSAGVDKDTGESVFDEIEVPATLAYKLVELVEITRTVKYVEKKDLPTRVKEDSKLKDE